MNSSARWLQGLAGKLTRDEAVPGLQLEHREVHPDVELGPQLVGQVLGGTVAAGVHPAGTGRKRKR